MDERSRAAAHRTLERSIAAIDDGGLKIRDHVEGEAVEVLVGRRARGKGATSSAQCILSGSTLEVRTPAKVGWSGDVLSIVGPIETPGGSEPLARLRGTLDSWEAGLSQPIRRSEEMKAVASVEGCAVLLRAAAQMIDPAWSAAALAAFGDDVLAVLVEFDATVPTRSRLFTSDQAHAPTGTISPGLVRAFGQAAGAFVHAIRLRTNPGHLLPRLEIGPQPRVRVVNDGDSMAIMRAVAVMPADARLMLPG